MCILIHGVLKMLICNFVLGEIIKKSSYPQQLNIPLL